MSNNTCPCATAIVAVALQQAPCHMQNKVQSAVGTNRPQTDPTKNDKKQIHHFWRSPIHPTKKAHLCLMAKYTGTSIHEANKSSSASKKIWAKVRSFD